MVFDSRYLILSAQGSSTHGTQVYSSVKCLSCELNNGLVSIKFHPKEMEHQTIKFGLINQSVLPPVFQLGMHALHPYCIKNTL